MQIRSWGEPSQPLSSSCTTPAHLVLLCLGGFLDIACSSLELHLHIANDAHLQLCYISLGKQGSLSSSMPEPDLSLLALEVVVTGSHGF